MIRKNKAFLVVLQIGKKYPHFLEDSLEEMTELATSSGFEVVGHITSKVHKPNSKQLVGGGKLEEIGMAAKKLKINRLIFNVDLTPVQARNIKKAIKFESLDRTGLILDIFGRRAKSKEGKLQVELASLQYKLPRLGGLGTVMSRLGGGIGTRGPGETELEHDRRKTYRRIQRVKQELKKVSKHRDLIRAGRKRKQLTTVALVGYTNAGKSTLLNALTGAETYVADKLFATLDPKTRVQNVNGRSDILFVDTVGFIRDLPHALVESFHATLEGVSEADALIHVLDVSHPSVMEFKKATDDVLGEIKAADIPQILALNKADLLNEEDRTRIQEDWPDAILISAKNKLGMNSLLAKLGQIVEPESEESQIKPAKQHSG